MMEFTAPKNFEEAMAGLIKHFAEHVNRQDLAASMAYIMTFYTMHKAGVLTQAPPDFMVEIVSDVAMQLGVVIIDTGRKEGERPN